MGMRIKLMVSEAHYSEISRELMEKGFEIDDSADLILSEKNVYAERLIGRRGEEIFRLRTSEISHIESFAHDVIAHSDGREFKITERLRRLEEILDPKEFIRVSNSVIVSVNHIKSIKPTIGQKFVLTLSDGSKTDVTRTYYYIFKEFIGI
ncbi:LytTr DNA-binding domain-containing protein [Ruminococcus sp. YE71]|uniref:LytTR family DNA-binding domain-containing protein n=1 Tax=unclassified Ruminococcus TaxID=2608920 RepID=UPI00088610FB|nr:MULTISPECIES: LytTR family DNA-binding domain-containing protein [unclassified Ruminococcus]SDA32475.1 LytTr DNA-binding domain-containing protein [Ruminococcus sp. YE78]SFW53377.1 LytTr DNA-binding domain-containing protein [Ruminococcus sp. YE71]